MEDTHGIPQTPSQAVFNGRKQALSPEPLGRSRRWHDRQPRDVQFDWASDTITASGNGGRPDIPVDDETDFDSYYGSHDPECE